LAAALRPDIGDESLYLAARCIRLPAHRVGQSHYAATNDQQADRAEHACTGRSRLTSL
jgi:hypothetical protein